MKNEAVLIENKMLTVIEKNEERGKIFNGILNAITSKKNEYSNGILHNISNKAESALNVFLNDSNNNDELVSLIEKHLPTFKAQADLNDVQGKALRLQIAHLGLETLRTELKVHNVNQTTNALKKINNLNDTQFAQQLKLYADDLRQSIQKNRKATLSVNEALEENCVDSLLKASELINPNSTTSNNNIDKEIGDFLNGGDLIL